MMDFASYLKSKRQEKGFTLRGFADALNIAPSYMSDIEKGKRNAPTQDILERMMSLLELDIVERIELIDLAAMQKDIVAQDIKCYVSENSAVRVALRKARELNLGEEEWLKIIEEMEKDKK